MRKQYRQVIHLVEGSESYGVAAVLRQISMYMPFVRFMALAPGEMTQKLPPEQLLWLGDRSLTMGGVGKSSWRGILSIVAIIPRWWAIAGDIANAMPALPILVHCHSIFIVILSALVMLRRPSLDMRVLFHFHSTMNPRRLMGVLPVIQRVIVGLVADGVVAVSQAVADYWRPLRCPVWVVYNGVESHMPSSLPAYFVQRPGVRNILIAASLSHDKGHQVAIDAMQLLGSRVSEFHLWIAGGATDEALNPFAKELRNLIQQYDLDSHVTLLGYLTDLRNLIPLMWICLQQRITPEPCSIWVLEAMSAGLPLVASATGGTPELVRHGQDGLLVPPDNPRSVAEAILLLADDSALRDRLAANGSRRAKNYSVQNFIDNIAQIYAEFSR